MDRPKKARARFLTDEAITDLSQDRLGHSLYVDLLIATILDTDPKFPFNIGLFGKWGSGKTGIVNLLKKRIETDASLKGKAEFVYIDAWSLSKESLRQEILIELNAKLPRFSAEQIQEMLYYVHTEETESAAQLPLGQRMDKILTASIPYIGLFVVFAFLAILIKWQLNLDFIAPMTVLVLIPLLLRLVDRLDAAASAVRKSQKRIIPQVSSPQQFKKLLSDTLSVLKSQKLVIAIDNLDRCDSEVAVEMLGSIKSLMEMPRSVYLVACDSDALEKHLQQTKRFEPPDAKEFLRKFFQTSIPIPPLIDGEFADYVDYAVDQIDIDFGQSVKEVLMAAASRNPRRVKQFLNNLAAAYRLAAAREERGILREGVVTSNTGFLAKVTVLRDEWPAFFKELEKNDSLLSDVERFFMFGATEPPVAIKEAPPELLAFLRATRIVTAPDLRPFLRLSQETYESSIADLSAFRNRVLNGEVETVNSMLGKLSQEERIAYFREIMMLVETTSRQRKSSQLFNCLTVVLAFLHLAPGTLKLQLTRVFEIYVFDLDLVTNLRRLDAGRIFDLLLNMNSSSRERLVILYGGLLVLEKKLDVELFKSFLAKRAEIGALGIAVLNEALSSLLAANEDEFHATMRDYVLKDQKLIRDIIGQRLISDVVSRINTKAGDAKNTANIEFYFKVKSEASERNKADFVRALVLIMKAPPQTTILEQRIAFPLGKLMALDQGDVPRTVIGECMNDIVKLADNMADYLHKLALYRFGLKHYKILDKDEVEVLLQHLKPLVERGPHNAIQELAKSAREFEAPILSSPIIVSSLAARIKGDMPDQALMEYLIEGTLPETKAQVIGLIVELLQTNDPGRFRPALNAAASKKASLTDEELGKICVACAEALRRLGISHASTLLDSALKLLPSSSDVAQKVLSDLLVEFMKSDDAQTRNNGSTYYRRIREQITPDRRREITHQIVVKIQSMQNSVDQVAALIDLVLEDQNLLDDQYRDQLIDLLTAQLSTAKGSNVQLLGVNSLARLAKLDGRTNQALNGILALAKAATPEVRAACKKALDSMRKFGGSKDFWNQAEALP